MSAGALLAALLAAQATPPGPENPLRFFDCEATAQTVGGKVSIASRLDEKDRYIQARGHSWAPARAGQAAFAVHWLFATAEPRISRSYAIIEVPLRRKLPEGQVLKLVRDGWLPPQMALHGSTETLTAFRPHAVVQVDLETLLAYAGDARELGWEVGGGLQGRVRDRGRLDLAPLRAIVAAFTPLLADLQARRSGLFEPLHLSRRGRRKRSRYLSGEKSFSAMARPPRRPASRRRPS
ncbi:MAG TPA: hypothetical protein VF759_00800 [Allosphingosinicella sp.]